MKKNKIFFIATLIITIPIIVLLAQCKVMGESPTIELEIYDGPQYSEKDNSCYYRVEANTTGVADSEVKFSLDDNVRELGPGRVEVRVDSGDSYTLTATAKNLFGTATFSLVLSGDCNGVTTEQINAEAEIEGESEQIDDDTGQTSLKEKENNTDQTPENKDKKENNNPIIKEITIPQKLDSNPAANELYNLYVSASDPDGDELSYTWSSDGGKISGASNLVYWETPPQAGTYTVQVKVTDGKGGEAIKSRTFNVLPAVINLTVPKVVSEGGHIEIWGNLNAGDALYAGDSLANKTCMGFISFDITSIPEVKIESANVSFSLSDKHGDPSFYKLLVLTETYWGTRTIEQSDTIPIANELQTFPLSEPSFSCSNEELKNALQNAVNAKKPRFQLRIHFRAGVTSDYDNQLDGWVYQQNDVTLSITYTP